MRRLCTGLIVVPIFLSLALAQVPRDLVGIYTRVTTIGKGGWLQPGTKVTNELIVYEDPDAPGGLSAFVSSVAPDAVRCAVHGPLGNVTTSGFTVGEKLWDSTCSVSVEREGSDLRITGSADCGLFCGNGGSFASTTYRKICPTVTPEVIAVLEERIWAIDPDYGPACR